MCGGRRLGSGKPIKEAQLLEHRRRAGDQWVLILENGGVARRVGAKLLAALLQRPDAVLAVVLQVGQLHRNGVSSAGAEAVQRKVIVQRDGAFSVVEALHVLPRFGVVLRAVDVLQHVQVPGNARLVRHVRQLLLAQAEVVEEVDVPYIVARSGVVLLQQRQPLHLRHQLRPLVEEDLIGAQQAQQLNPLHQTDAEVLVKKVEPLDAHGKLLLHRRAVVEDAQVIGRLVAAVLHQRHRRGVEVLGQALDAWNLTGDNVRLEEAVVVVAPLVVPPVDVGRLRDDGHADAVEPDLTEGGRRRDAVNHGEDAHHGQRSASPPVVVMLLNSSSYKLGKSTRQDLLVAPAFAFGYFFAFCQ
ncbi:hypothetical protein TYRP_020519 [Tyrophagus putrescentiae]|nr:hypothetical protein TYRP_020519 [Tyrophagus putrescentiae]